MKQKRLLALLLPLAFLVALAPAYLRAYTVNGPSMAPTLWYGDRVIVSLAAYDLRLPYTDTVLAPHGEPNRGDLILYYDEQKKSVALKRLVGLPGDTIELRENVLLVNGLPADQDPLPREAFERVPPENDLGERVVSETLDDNAHLLTFTAGKNAAATFGSVTVPAGEYFILGDNRDNSQDSRIIGGIRRAQIKGRVLYGQRRAPD